MKNNQGFTLIELLLVIVVLAVITALSVPNFSKSFTQLELKKTAQNIAYIIRWAQSRAINDNLSYRLVFLNNSRQYRILRAAAPTETSSTFAPIPVQMGRIFNVPASIKITSPATVDIYADGSLEKVRIQLENSTTQMIISSMELRGKVFVLEEKNER